MKVFISWSGAASRELGVALQEWFPKVLQAVDPFISAKDIDKGANWSSILMTELEDSGFGVVCLAPDNLLSPWLHFEAGTMVKSVQSRVCPVLLGVKKSDVGAPMSQLQLTSIDIADIHLLMISMNKAAREPLTESRLKESVEMWWPELEARIKSISLPNSTSDQSKTNVEPDKPESNSLEFLNELLTRVRDIDDRLSDISRNPVIGSVRVAEEKRASMRQRQNAATFLKELLWKFGFQTIDWRASQSEMRFILEGELPDVLPSELEENLLGVSSLEQTTIRIIARNKRFSFANGSFESSDNL